VYDNGAGVVEDVWKFAKNHSAFVAGVSLGILVVLAPEVVEVMGFVELGPIDGRSLIMCTEANILIPCFPIGTYTARWQSTYSGQCPSRIVLFILSMTRDGYRGCSGHRFPSPPL